MKNFLRKLQCGGFKISKNYAFEWQLFDTIRTLDDGITFIDFSMNLDLYKSDHKPSTEIGLMVLNTIIFNFTIYNINHIDYEISEEEFFERMKISPENPF